MSVATMVAGAINAMTQLVDKCFKKFMDILNRWHPVKEAIKRNKDAMKCGTAEMIFTSC